jgi:hypothetical protein
MTGTDIQATKIVKIDVSQFGAAGQHIAAIQRNSQRGLPELAPSVIAHDGTMVLVGSGHSLPTFIEEIREQQAKGRTICAIKGSHDLLCEHGIIPDLFVSIEPRDRRGNLKHKNEHTVYLLASRVSPEVFDHLDGCKVMIWHSAGHQSENEVTLKTAGKNLILGGGSTSGLRAIALGYCYFGFRNFILYGYDSCNAADGTKRFDGSMTGITHPPIFVGEGEHRKGPFICNMAMAAQAEEFQLCTYGLFPDIHIEARGNGLIAAIIEERKRLGKRT